MTRARSELPSDIQLVAERLEASLRADDALSPDFDFDGWLQDWLERPQPALGGCTPRSLLGSEPSIKAVRRALGAIMSGAFQ